MLRSKIEKNKYNLQGVVLYRTNLEGANLCHANLQNAKLYDVNLQGANLRNASLYNANLEGSNLRHANLEGANLRHAKLEGAIYNKNVKFGKTPPIQILNLRWWVFILKNHIQIGCEFHSKDEWKNFTDNEISVMHSKALEFWGKYKNLILEF